MDDWEPLSDLVSAIKSKQMTAFTLVKRALNSLKQNSQLQTVISTLEAEALKRAEAIDDQLRAGNDPGRLAGVPFIAKDNFLVYGSDTTAASNILIGFKAPYQASAINKLEEAGAICVGKANMDAFALGASTENSDFFVTKNPLDQTRVPGGSSGGSAAAVALGIVPFAIGTDTGGSIRQPASFCGVFGYKPTYGLVSRSGVVAMGSSLDCVGPMSRRAVDSALVLDVMSGKDELDGTTIEKDPAGYLAKPLSLGGVRVGVVKEYLGDGVDPEVAGAIQARINQLKTAGASIKDISLASIPLALACYYIICPAEVSSNLSRYDGQKFGYYAKDAKTLDQSYVDSRGKGFGKEAKRRIMVGTYVLSSGYYDAYYKKAQTVRSKIINEFKDAFKQVDFLVGPVAPTTAFKIGEKTQNPLEMYLSDVMTVAANLAGIPAASIPSGRDAKGLPIGFQAMADQRQDRQLLEFCRTIEELS